MLSFNIAASHVMLNVLKNKIDEGSGSGYIIIYTGGVDGTDVPATADAALTGNNIAIAQLTCSKPCAVVDNKTILFSPIADDTSVTNVNGWSPVFFRMFNSNDEVILQGTVSGSGGGGDLQMVTYSLPDGGTATIKKAVFTLY